MARFSAAAEGASFACGIQNFFLDSRGIQCLYRALHLFWAFCVRTFVGYEDRTIYGYERA
jgi:hypothetical protein